LDQKTVDELLEAIIVRVESAIRGKPPSLFSKDEIVRKVSV
jgi:hypothetical protein